MKFLQGQVSGIIVLVVVASLLMSPVHAQSFSFFTPTNSVFASYAPPNYSGVCFHNVRTETLVSTTFYLGISVAGSLTLHAFVSTVTSGSPSGANCVHGSTVAVSNSLTLSNLPLSTYASVTFSFNNQKIGVGDYVVAVSLDSATNGANVKIFGNNEGDAARSDNDSVFGSDFSTGTCSQNNCSAYSLNDPVTLCNQGQSGAVIGAGALVIVMTMFGFKMIDEKLKDNSRSSSRFVERSSDQTGMFMGIILAVAIAILLVVIITSTAPAGGPC